MSEIIDLFRFYLRITHWYETYIRKDKYRIAEYKITSQMFMAMGTKL